ncbi:serine protease [Bremerella cremea]|uniref:Serine protease n=1 Tax=Bremerella cremea TaxID=1031537 RepID=A0A368KKW2_9BACT|nr:serine protease [Bremerella cremea]RCS41416.1 serine protease [Bremerella cremea]
MTCPRFAFACRFEALAMVTLTILLGTLGCGSGAGEPGGNTGGGLFGSGPAQEKSFESTVVNAAGKIVPYDKQPPYKARPTELHYQLEKTSRFIYKVETTVNFPDKDSIYLGQITYTVPNLSPEYVLRNQKKEEQEGEVFESSGTGFVVHAEGFLVTCAHVVEGSTKIEAHIGGKTYPAKVVDIDSKHDLALIRVDTTGLTPIAIMDSAEVQLAEEIRVVGYPLSDVLGESLKIARGTVSGIDNDRPNRVFQLDATVNPGNSGGPVVNEKGHVAGVATSLLSGDGLSNVGFAVPANQVREMLERQKIPFQAADAAEPYLRGPDLAKRVTPSVAFLKVTSGPNGVGTAEDKVVSFSGSLAQHVKPQIGSMYRIAGVRPLSDSGHLLMKPHGELSYNGGERFLPNFIGFFSTIGLEPLPESDSDEWQVANIRIIPQKKESKLVVEEDPLMADLLRLSPALQSRFRFGLNPQIKEIPSYDLHPAVEKADYKIIARRGNLIEIEKSYELKTMHENSHIPFLHLVGKATIQFDKKIGRIQSVSYKGRADYHIDDIDVSLPMSYKCTLEKNYPPYKPDPQAVAKSKETSVPVVKELPNATGLRKLELGN